MNWSDNQLKELVKVWNKLRTCWGLEPVMTRRTFIHKLVEFQNQLEKLVELQNQFKELVKAWKLPEKVMEIQSNIQKPVSL